MEIPLANAHANVALPRVVHSVVELPASTRIVIVGDVHACYDELVALLRECAYDAANNDRLVFVGDLVNKGPKPVEVVRFVRESNALCVRGNHDDAALSKYYEWQANGRVPGSMGAYSYVAHFSREDVQFLEQLPFTLTLPNQNAIIVHGGLVPDASLSVQRPLDMYKMRYLHRVCAHPSGSAAGEEGAWVASEKRDGELEGVQVLWATQWRGPMHVYFGHDASAGLQEEAFATGLDTGCCYGRELTACILPTREIVKVAAKQMYVVPMGPG